MPERPAHRTGLTRRTGLIALAVAVAVLVVAALLTGGPGGGGDGPGTGSARAPGNALSTPTTVRAGGPLPSDAECADSVERTGRELRPENTEANNTVPRGVRVPAWTDPGYAPELNEVVIPRIDGQFTGTTDEIIQWGACKWGLNADVVRAMAVEESGWRQPTRGDISYDDADCVPGETAPCATSFGLLQVKHIFRPGSYPYSAESTAFNVDYALGVIRACYEGWVTYLEPVGYERGDMWGCIGWHFSGEWRDPLGLQYVDGVQSSLEEAPWRRW
ncbi:MAG TPA: hypothetical protein VD813_01280 [Pseudonocardia sp.]|nr:hypothetical protein [Pseudonocardia sp.]